MLSISIVEIGLGFVLKLPNLVQMSLLLQSQVGIVLLLFLLLVFVSVRQRLVVFFIELLDRFHMLRLPLMEVILAILDVLEQLLDLIARFVVHFLLGLRLNSDLVRQLNHASLLVASLRLRILEQLRVVFHFDADVLECLQFLV